MTILQEKMKGVNGSWKFCVPGKALGIGELDCCLRCHLQKGGSAQSLQKKIIKTANKIK